MLNYCTFPVALKCVSSRYRFIFMDTLLVDVLFFYKLQKSSFLTLFYGYLYIHLFPSTQPWRANVNPNSPNIYIFYLLFSEDQLPPGFPTIDMGPQLKVVERTRTATMLCAASGNPDPDISWFKDFLPVNTTNNNGRIKQLRSGRSCRAESLLLLLKGVSFLVSSI